MRSLTAATLAVLLGSAAPVWAQFDPTVVPDRPAQKAPPPQQPAIEQAPLDQAAPEGGDQLPAKGVYQQGLDSLDPSSPGILTEANGGFPGSMWQGSDRRALVALLPRMPIGKGSPAMRSLAERLLLSEAQVPQGTSKNVYDVFQGRIDRLVAAGYSAEVADLFSRVPEKIADSRLSHARVDALLLAGDAELACNEALAANQRSEEDSWLQVVAYCKLVQGDASGAAFSADMLRETGADDADYFTLLAYLSQPAETRGEKPTLKNDKPLTPLRLVMLKASGSDIAAAALEQAGPVVLVAVANDETLPPDIRLEAAERAARASAISAKDLAAAYAGVTLNAPDLADPVAAAAAQSGGRGGALLYQAAMQAPDPVAKLAVLRAIWTRSKADDTYLLAARVNVEATKALWSEPTPVPVPEPAAPESLDPSQSPVPLMPEQPVSPPTESVALAPELLAAAPEIIRALLAAGEVDAARAWYGQVADAASGGDPEATVTQAQLWPLMTVADADTAFSETALDAWWQNQSALGGGDRSGRGALLMAVLEGLGQPAPAAFWNGLYDGAESADGRLPSLPAWRGLNAASEAGRLGETVLLALVVLGDAGPAKASPAVLTDVLKALDKVGLERDARALALEALIVSGF